MAVPCGQLASSGGQESLSVRRALSNEEIEWNDKRHSIVVGGKTIALTRTEYRLLYLLRDGIPVSYDEMAELIYHCAMDKKVRTMMDKHFDRIRGKLRDKGIYVYCVLYYGYALLPEFPQPETSYDLPLPQAK